MSPLCPQLIRTLSRLPYAGLVLCLSIATAPMGIAQEALPSTESALVQAEQSEALRQSYGPEFFTAFAPRTARDMVERIPGFSVRGGNDNGRGLGQGGANVLINGARISGKSMSPRDALSRIPAGTVLRIEILDGAQLNIAGLTGDVANIVATAQSGLSGTWRWRAEARQGREPNYLNGDISVTGKTGALSYTLAFESDGFYGGAEGPEFIFDGDGTLIETAEERQERDGQRPELSVALSYAPREDVTANLNATYSQFNFNGDEVSRREAVTSEGQTSLDLFDRIEDEIETEVSADISFPLPLNFIGIDGAMKLIAVNRYEDSPTRSRSQTFPLAEPSEQSVFFRDQEEGETIGRVEYSWIPQDGRDWQISAETAFNYLDISDALFSAVGSDALTEETLDDPKARVEERRSEIIVAHNRKITDKFALQLSLGAEISELSKSGASSNVREFIRPKGFIKGSYAWDDTLDLRFEADRRVGQLSFGDFIGAVDIQDGSDQSGNSDLVPVQFWNLALEAEKEFGEGSNARLRLFYEDIEDLVDRIPVGIDGDGVGNIETAYASGAILTSTINGARWGFEGTELELFYMIQFHRVEDPVTLEQRRISGRPNSRFEINFRHDIPRTDWAYGLGGQFQRNVPQYRLEEISHNGFGKPFSYVFVEHKDVFGLTVRGQVLNLLNAPEFQNRTVYTDRRDRGEIDFISRRKRTFETFARLQFSGTF